MIIYNAKNYEEMSKKASNIIKAQVVLNPNSVLGLATGSTPEGTYKNLVEDYKNGDIDFSNVKSVNLDEYKGLKKDDTQSYAYFMKKHLFSHINICEENTYIPNGLDKNEEKMCKDYDRQINELGGVDLQLLGIGVNSHIGFNEPSDVFENGVHCVKLTDETIEANSRFFDDKSQVPQYAYSMGIGNIMQAKKILLVASGKSKAQAIYDSFFGKITPSVQGSILQLHKDVVIVADDDALSIVREKGLI